jgi:hypothetical protein
MSTQDNMEVAPTSSWRPFTAASLEAFSKAMLLVFVLHLIISWRDLSEYSSGSSTLKLTSLDQVEDALLLLSQDDKDFSLASKGPTNSSRIENLHMAFVRDSLIRYQYLSFVHYLKTG